LPAESTVTAGEVPKNETAGSWPAAESVAEIIFVQHLFAQDKKAEQIT
jgi:hypothetical protein